MINRIFTSFIFISCLFALFLSLNGVLAPVWFGDKFRAFIVSTNYDLQHSWLGNIRIPDIPSIQNIGFLPWSNNAWTNIIVLLNNFFNGFAKVINGVVTILNVIILLINTLFELLSFILIFLRNIITLKDSIVYLPA